MACGCGKSREERNAEREARAERIRAVRAEKAAIREQQRAAQVAARSKAA